jgi:integrase
MSVVPKPRAKGKTVYGVSNTWKGKEVWELIGPSRRAAEIRDREMKREIKAGTFVPKESMKALTVLQLCEVWGAPRTNASADDERSLVRRYVETAPELAQMIAADVKPRHVLAWVQHWQAQRKPDGSRLIGDKTIANAVGVLRMVFELGVMRELCTMNPVQLPRKTLRRSVTKEKEIYSLAESAVLMRHHSIPWPIRVLNAMILLSGMREGEACGRRFRDLDDGPKPLSLMRVHDQYNSKPLKTERPRVVPIHPELHRVLTEWAQEGFELYTGAKPTLDDFIVPNCSPRAKARNHTESSFYKQFVKHAEAAGVRPRSVHATRHSFITHCRRGGARKDVLERVTHNAKGDIVDGYTHWEWEPLCEAVSCLDLDVRRDLHPVSRNDGENGGSFLASISGNSLVFQPNTAVNASSIPAASNENSLVLQGPPKTRQGTRQGKPGQPAEDPRAAHRLRKRKLLALREADPVAAKPGLALCRALDGALAGDQAKVLKQLGIAAEAYQALEDSHADDSDVVEAVA